MIKIENLVKVYDNGLKAVNDISLEVKKEKFLVLSVWVVLVNHL